jgi:hypothetical protein
MSIFDFNDSVPKGPESKKPLKLFLGASILVGALTLGSTLAANINLNDGGNVEFGQGVTRTVACDSDGITLTPYSTFINAPGAGEHTFSSLKVSGIDSSLDKCAGKTFLIKAYGESGPALDLFKWESKATPQSEWAEVDRYDFIEIKKDADEFTWISDGTDDDDVISETSDITQTAFTLLFTSDTPTIRRTPLASAQDIKRITIETYDQRLLDNRAISTSQFGFYIPSDILGDGLPSALGGPLAEGNYTGTECAEPLCFAYTTFDEMINDLTDADMVNFNSGLETDLTRSELSSALTIRLNYDPTGEEGERWSLVSLLFGELIGEDAVGEVIGFNGNTGIFLVDGQLSASAVFFSLNGALTSNSVIGAFTPYGDQPLRTLPIRNFREIWDGSESLYNE